MHGEYKQSRFRKQFVDLPGGLQAVEFRHGKIEDHNVRMLGYRHRNSFPSGCGFGADFPILFTLQYLAYMAANDWMIIGY